MSDYPSITQQESDSINNGLCPDCGKDELYKGPRGGMMVNIRCDNCGSRFNIADPEMGFPGTGNKEFKQRIGPKSPLKA